MAACLLQPLAGVKPSKPCPLSSPCSGGLAHPPCCRISSPRDSGQLSAQLHLLLPFHEGMSRASPCHMGAEIVMVLPGLLRSGFLLGLAQEGSKTTWKEGGKTKCPYPWHSSPPLPQTSPKMERWSTMWLTSWLTGLSPHPFIHTGEEGNLYFPFLNPWDLLLSSPDLKAET